MKYETVGRRVVEAEIAVKPIVRPGLGTPRSGYFTSLKRNAVTLCEPPAAFSFAVARMMP